MKTMYNEENMLQKCVSECEKAVITHVLIRANGCLPEAARLLGMNRKNLLGKLREYGLDSDEDVKLAMAETITNPTDPG